jgi:hypothetical protein
MAVYFIKQARAAKSHGTTSAVTAGGISEYQLSCDFILLLPTAGEPTTIGNGW